MEILDRIEELVMLNVVPNLKSDKSHSIKHFRKVRDHAIMSVVHLDEDEQTKEAITVAAILHDVDDEKLVINKCTTHNSWALYVLETLAIKNKDMILKMIDLVSCSKNGDRFENGLPLYYYIPRYCDRLEAIGKNGLKRCIQYNNGSDRPMHNDNTARVYSKDELYNVATKERYDLYSRGVIKSETVIDHLYDKLLHIRLPQWFHNQYLEDQFNKEQNYIEDYVIDYWNELRM